MFLQVSYEKEFDDLWMHLKAKYSDKIFDIDGLGKQLDMIKFHNDFFSKSTSTTADVSIDANSNVDDVSIITYHTEMPKPFLKLNSYYTLWKELKRLYDRVTADKIIEMQVSGDIYINDVHGIGGALPYSYHKKTSIVIKNNRDIEYLSMQDLFDKYNEHLEILPDREQINLSPFNLEILEDNNKFVPLKWVLRHKNHTTLKEIETKNGYTTVVTSDHPVITDSGEINAEDITLEDSLKISESKLPILESQLVNGEYAYYLGFMIGDGFVNVKKGVSGRWKEGALRLSQKNIQNTKIGKYIMREFPNAKLEKNGGELRFGGLADCLKHIDLVGRYSENVHLPKNILNWNVSSIKQILAGVIDSDGSVNPNGIIDIRVSSYQLVQQIAEICRTLNIGKTRTSFLKPYKQSGYKTNLELYKVSIRIHDKEMVNYSEKISKNLEAIYKEVGIDGRFETNKVHKIQEPINNEEYVYDITTETGIFHCQGLIQHNCFNYSTYDIMINGLPMIKKIKSIPPKYLYSFKSQVEQFTIIAANSTLGATGLADFLVVMSYYVGNILKTKSDCHVNFASMEDCWKYVEENLRSFIYTINQPTRGNQSCFTNVSIFDKNFLENMKENYLFPDGSLMDIDLIWKVQELFLQIIEDELSRTPITFPVLTACFSVDKEKNILDLEFAKLIAKYNKKYGNINIFSGDSSILSSCCRLRSESDNEYFNSFGAGSSKIGSLGVVTVNLPRIAFKNKGNIDRFKEDLKELIKVCSQINNAKRKVVQKRVDSGNHILYSLNFIDINKQYSTVGLNGFNESIEILGEDILEEEGQNLGLQMLELINNENDRYAKQYASPHNMEIIPGEQVSIKLADKDRILKYNKEYIMYSNQFIPLTKNADLLDRIKIQGLFDNKCTGGSIMHCNVETQIEDEEQIVDLIKLCAKQGVIYWSINYNLQECKKGHMTVGKKETCSICNSEIVNNYLRVVGFLTSVKNWHPTRREIDYPNRQFYKGV